MRENCLSGGNGGLVPGDRAFYSLLARQVERDRVWRNQKIAEVVRDLGSSRKEIADFLGMHYSTVIRIWRRTSSSISKSTA
jgi:hypothetical protein